MEKIISSQIRSIFFYAFFGQVFFIVIHHFECYYRIYFYSFSTIPLVLHATIVDDFWQISLRSDGSLCPSFVFRSTF